MVGINIEVLRRKSPRCMEEYVVLRITLQKKKRKEKERLLCTVIRKQRWPATGRAEVVVNGRVAGNDIVLLPAWCQSCMSQLPADALPIRLLISLLYSFDPYSLLIWILLGLSSH